MKKLILASASPRRQELLSLLGCPFEVMVSDREEIITHINPAEVTKELSLQKAQTVAAQVDEGIIIGADTVVAAEGKILGKPANELAACEMLQSIQGKSHMVYTGVTILEKGNEEEKTNTFFESTKVWIAPMSKKEIQNYVQIEKPYDKAGAYGIQGSFSCFVERIEGDYFNVVGLPLHRLYQELKACPVMP